MTRSDKTYAVAAGQVLRAARTRRHVSQVSLARRAGTSQRHISRIERGEVSPSVDTLARLLSMVGEELHLETAPSPHRYDRDDLAHEIGRPMAERLDGALAWNDFAAEIGGAAAAVR
jgi:transcriptional regulator with XRE-family HTH domain